MSKALDLEKIKKKLDKPISSEEALKDVVPFNWGKEVLDGKKKIIVSKRNE